MSEAVDGSVVKRNEDPFDDVAADIPHLPGPIITIPVGFPPAAPAVTTVLPVTLSYTPEVFHLTRLVGKMTAICEHCQATNFPGETKSISAAVVK